MDPIRTKILIRQCKNCRLHSISNGPVPFRGKAPADICVIGEAPGYYEDRDLQPFVGPAGTLTQELLADGGIDLDTIAWMNVVSCWPGVHRKTPTREEVDACERNVQEQLNCIRPRYCIVFGGVATNALLRVRTTITEVRGFWYSISYDGGSGSSWVLSSYHPAAILRRPSLRKTVEGDVAYFKAVSESGKEPEVNTWCVKCGKRFVEIRVQGLGYCSKHVPLDKHQQMILFKDLKGHGSS